MTIRANGGTMRYRRYAIRMNDAQSRAGDSGPVIPAKLVVGVTGHRVLPDPVALVPAIGSALASIRQMAPALKHTPLFFSVLSPLAEGADRLLAREILPTPGAVLEAVLPMEKDQYAADFSSPQSVAEFHQWLARAKTVRILPSRRSRADAYEQAGRYVVEQCDVLLAVWNGRPADGQGGTAEIVRYALDNHCPVIWINAENPAQIKVVPGRGIGPEPFLALDRYNAERVDRQKLERQRLDETAFLAARVAAAGMPAGPLQPVFDYVMPHYLKSDFLANKNQNYYYLTETLTYGLALAAILIAAFQNLFFPSRPLILLAEVFLMVLVLGVIYYNRHEQWQKNWIDYRFLAERFRAMFFMSAANIDVSLRRTPRYLSLAYSDRDWKILAYAAAWIKCPRLGPAEKIPLESLKAFLGNAWLEHQMLYHLKTQKRHRFRYRVMNVTSNLLFGLTICVIIVFIFLSDNLTAQNVLSLLAVIFPAFAATVSAIRIHRDYLRTSARSEEMARHLRELHEKLSRAQNTEEFIETITETEETMLHENEDWRVVMRFHQIDPV